MKIVAIIPARYDSSRLPGKPLLDICGRPMLYRVYEQIRKISEFDKVICAIDDERIKDVCEQLDMLYIMTSKIHPNHISRVQEVASKIEADYYFCINGDEPLILEECIRPLFPKNITVEPYFRGAMKTLTDPAETIDFSNIKLAVSDEGKCIYMSRAPIPYPRGTLLFKYKKYIGIECFNKQALDLFISKPAGYLERVEDIDHLRFLENGIPIYFTEVNSKSISVDTEKDLEKVRMLYASRRYFNE